jgi:hypothetical protein
MNEGYRSHHGSLKPTFEHAHSYQYTVPLSSRGIAGGKAGCLVPWNRTRRCLALTRVLPRGEWLKDQSSPGQVPEVPFWSALGLPGPEDPSRVRLIRVELSLDGSSYQHPAGHQQSLGTWSGNPRTSHSSQIATHHNVLLYQNHSPT